MTTDVLQEIVEAIEWTAAQAKSACKEFDKNAGERASALRDIDRGYCVGNERFLHHWFSYKLQAQLKGLNEENWRLIPEARSTSPFDRFEDSIKPDDPEKTAEAFTTEATRGSLDFRLCGDKTCYAIEFKGPKATPFRSLVIDMLKLHTEFDSDDAFFISMLCDHRNGPYHTKPNDHIDNMARAILFAKGVAAKVENGKNSPALHIYSLSNTVAELKARDALSNTSSADDRGKAGIIHWGPFTGGKEVGTPLEQAYFALENPSAKSTA